MNERARPWGRSFWPLLVGQFLSIVGLTVMVPLLPFYLEDLGMTGTQGGKLWVGLALAAPALTLVVSAPLWGRLGDRWGRKWMVVRALGGLAVSMVLMGLATTPLQFLLCRLLQGAFGGVVESAAAFAAAEAPPDARGRVQGSLQSAAAAGALAGPLIGGFLVEFWGLRPLLLTIGVLTGISGLLAALVLREQARTASDRSNAMMPLHCVAGRLLRHSHVRAFVLAGLCIQAGAYGLVTVFAPHVRGLLHGSAGAAAWVGALQAVTWTATAMSAPWWGRRNDQSPVERNFVHAAAGCAVSIALQAWPGHVGWLIPLRLLQGFCFGALVQSIYLRVSRHAEMDQQGVQIGLANSFLTTGQIVGALTGGALAELLPTAGVILMMGGFFGIGSLLVWTTGYLRVERGVVG